MKGETLPWRSERGKIVAIIIGFIIGDGLSPTRLARHCWHEMPSS